MRKYRFLALFALFGMGLLPSHLLLQGCGNTSADLGSEDGVDLNGDGDSGGSAESESACEDTGEDVTVEAMTASVTGDPCNAPTPSDNSTTIVLDCTQPEARSTDADISDFTTITNCGDASGVYYCVSGVVFKDDGGDGEELFDKTEVSCVDDSGTEELVEDELIIG